MCNTVKYTSHLAIQKIIIVIGKIFITLNFIDFTFRLLMNPADILFLINNEKLFYHNIWSDKYTTSLWFENRQF